jgi:hypothetical protein
MVEFLPSMLKVLCSSPAHTQRRGRKGRGREGKEKQEIMLERERSHLKAK